MAKKALVTGRTQNRTALGIIAAYLEMYPSTTLNELKQIFAKSSVCPDAGNKIAFCKMWTAPSLAKLQQKAEQYGITAQVGDLPKTDPNYKVGYAITYEGGKKGIPFWVWIVLLALLAGIAYFLLANK